MDVTVQPGCTGHVGDFPEKQTQRDQCRQNAGEGIQQDKRNRVEPRQLAYPQIQHHAKANPGKGRE